MARKQFDGTCTLISSITIKNGNVADIQDAWRKFPLLMPLVRMQLHRRHLDGKQELEFSYTVPQRPDHELQEWCKSTCKVYEGLDRRRLQDLAVEGRNQLRPTKDQDASDVAHLYVSEDSSGIHMVFIFQHAVTDARGQWRVSRFALQWFSGRY